MAMFDHFKGVISMDVGNGNNIHFLEDIWCCPRPLKLEIPTIFNIASNKEASVANYWGNNGESTGWNIQLRHHLNDWEIECMVRLLGCINNIEPFLDKEDYHRWSLEVDGSLMVKSCYRSFEPQMVVSFSWEILWGCKPLSKVLFFGVDSS